MLGHEENHGPDDGTEQGATEQSSSMQPNYPLWLTCGSGDDHEDDQLTFLNKITWDYINVLYPYVPVVPTQVSQIVCTLALQLEHVLAQHCFKKGGTFPMNKTTTTTIFQTTTTCHDNNNNNIVQHQQNYNNEQDYNNSNNNMKQ